MSNESKHLTKATRIELCMIPTGTTQNPAISNPIPTTTSMQAIINCICC